MPPPVLAPGQPIPSTAYPFRVAIAPATWPRDGDGAPMRVEGSPETLACDLQFVSPTGEAVRPVDDEFPHGRSAANLVFRGRPAVAIGKDTAMLVVSGPGGAYDTPEEWTASGPPWDRGSGLWAVTATRRS